MKQKKLNISFSKFKKKTRALKTKNELTMNKYAMTSLTSTRFQIP